jgi:predicted hydrocarbon binding protein
MTEYFYPQRMARIILLAMEEVLGSEAAQAVLHLSSASDSDTALVARSEQPFSFKYVTRLMESLEQTFDAQGGRGAAFRIGRACFQYGLREYGSMLGITEKAFRLLPLHTKLHIGAKSFADLFNKHTDQRVRVDEQNGKLFWNIERCPLCWERQTSEPVCQLAAGLLQESLYWVSGGKIFNVEETACIARGDPACTFEIDQTPIS